jgi:hypothetical protein
MMNTVRRQFKGVLKNHVPRGGQSRARGTLAWRKQDAPATLGRRALRAVKASGTLALLPNQASGTLALLWELFSDSLLSPGGRATAGEAAA